MRISDWSSDVCSSDLDWTPVQMALASAAMDDPAAPAVERPERPDYAGPFDPDFRYEDLSKEALVRLVREYALIVHLLDRSMRSEKRRVGNECVRKCRSRWSPDT